MTSAVRYGQARTQLLLPHISHRHVRYHTSAVRGGQVQPVSRSTTLRVSTSNPAQRRYATIEAFVPSSCVGTRYRSLMYFGSPPQISSLGVKRWFSSTAQCGDAKVRSEEGMTEKQWSIKTVDVPVGGNGVVSLDIYTVVSDSAAVTGEEACSKDIFIYLPRGPSLEVSSKRYAGGRHPNASEEHGAFLNRLLGRLLCSEKPPTVVQIHYRLSPVTRLGSDLEDLRFPAPVHDVSIAFDWILSNRETLDRTRRDTTKLYDLTTLLNEQEPRVSIFGSHIGGSLALMLGLTQPNEIHSIAVHDPIVDWVGLDEIEESTSIPTPATTKRRTKVDLETGRLKTNAVAKVLIDLRTRLFRTPSGFFDAFASPLMFLRAPGRDTPLWKTAAPEVETVVTDGEQIAEVIRANNEIEVSEIETRELVHERGYGPYDDDWPTVKSNSDFQFDARSNNVGLAKVTGEEHDVGLSQITEDLSTLSLRGGGDVSQSMQDPTDLSPAQPRLQFLTLFNNANTNDDHILHFSSHEQLPTDLSSPVSAEPREVSMYTNRIVNNSTPFTRRRKVLRRWPPTGRPEDADLPHARIYSTIPRMPPSSEKTDEDLDLAYVLHPQAKEMADVMRRACFWGREKGLGEERVGLVDMDAGQPVDRGEVEDNEGSIVKRVVEWFGEVNRIEK